MNAKLCPGCDQFTKTITSNRAGLWRFAGRARGSVSKDKHAFIYCYRAAPKLAHSSSIALSTSANMKFSVAALALPIAVQAAHFSKSEYASGQIHQKLMKLKTVGYLCLGGFLQSFTNVCSRNNGSATQPRASRIRSSGLLSRSPRRERGDLDVQKTTVCLARMVLL